MISVRQISKLYGEVTAIKRISIDIPDGNRVAVLGPSGSGKTTLLRLIAGLEVADAGEIYIDGILASTPKQILEPYRRGLGFVFQTPALWPHMTVAQNILFGLHDVSRVEAITRLDELLVLVSLQGLERRYPHQLSGGEARRAALARTLAPRPRCLLMDEPLTNVDLDLKTKLLDCIKKAIEHTNASLIYVTHDAGEAESVSECVYMLRNGCLET